MVAKINIGSSLYGTLIYNFEKVDQCKAKVLVANKMMMNYQGNHSIKESMRTFEPHLVANAKTKHPVLHISLNPHPNDVLSDEQLAVIAAKYMQKMGYKDQPYIVFKHEDIDRHHLHIVSIRVDENGKKLNDSFEHRRSKNITRELEQEYGLHTAEKKQKTNETQTIKPINAKEGEVSTQIASIVKTLASTYQYSSITEFKALLSLFNVSVDEIKGEANGKRFQGLVYSALDKKGNRIGTPIKSSSISKAVGVEALQNRMNRTQALLGKTNIKDRTKGIITHAKAHCKGNRSKFENHLAQNNVSVLFRTNAAGRIYGATFVDHQTKLVLNGSRMGKEYSANVFEELFNGQKVQPTLKFNEDIKVKDMNLNTNTNINTNLNHELDLPFLNLGTDVEQEIFASRLEQEEKKRQRKRGRKM